MADTKTSALTELTTFDGDEEFYVVDDDDGTPVSKRVTIETLTTEVTDGIAAAISDGDAATLTSANAHSDALVSDTAYNAGTWDAVTTVAPSKNAVRDKIEGLSGTYAPINGAGTLLAVKRYGPAQTVLSTSSTSLVDVDATNMAVTFTAPPSTNVLVRLNAFMDLNGAAAQASWGLRESTTNLASGKVMRVADAEGFLSMAFYLTGLSAGSHTYKWSYGVSAGGETARIIVGPGAAVADFPAAVMEVWAAP